jgi:hypothetical protein
VPLASPAFDRVTAPELQRFQPRMSRRGGAAAKAGQCFQPVGPQGRKGEKERGRTATQQVKARLAPESLCRRTNLRDSSTDGADDGVFVFSRAA